MALDFGSVQKTRKTSGGGSENVAVMIAEVHLADKSKRTANTAEDYAMAYLLEDGFGKKAEFIKGGEHDGAPQTLIKIKMRPDRPSKGEYAPPEILDLQVGKRKGAALPMGEWPTIILERAFLDSRTDTVMAQWYKVCKRDANEQNDWCLTGGNLVSVEREYYNLVNNERKYRQARYSVLPEKAEVFNDMASFKAAAAKALTERTDIGGGQPVALLRIVRNSSFEDKQVPEVITKMIYPARVEGAEFVQYESGETSVEKWLSTDDKEIQAYVGFINQAPEEPDYTYEIIPMWRYNTGSQSLPSVKEKGFDDAERFSIPDQDRTKGYALKMKDNGDGPLMVAGFAVGSMMIKRNPVQDAKWYATSTFRKNGFGPIYRMDELVTPGLPAKAKALFEAQAAARGENSRSNFTKGKQQNQAPSQDDEIPFGEPDHSGGLTPS